MLQVFHICSDAVEVGGLVFSEQSTETGLASYQLANSDLADMLVPLARPRFDLSLLATESVTMTICRYWVAIWTQVPCLW